MFLDPFCCCIWLNFLQANLGLLKVLVAKSQAEGLQTHLQSMVEGLLNWQDSTRNHFKAKVHFCCSCNLNPVIPKLYVKIVTFML